jgi:metallo-beta-lactamase class B
MTFGFFKSALVLAVFSCTAAYAQQPAQQQTQQTPEPPEPAGATYHYAKAREIAGTDPDLIKWIDQGYLCKSPQVHNAMMVAKRAPANVTTEKPVKLFDNFYMVGSTYVDSFILKTSAGLVMWDTMNNPGDAQNIIEPGMKQLGLDPNDIKYIILTHGHGDHYGGAKYFQDKYHMPIGTTQEDWDLMANTPMRGFGPPPAKDQVLSDGQDLVIGDVTIHIVKTPGHTPGVASSVFPVKDKGVTRYLDMWGGTAYHDVLSQHDSLHKLWVAGQERHAVGMVNTHAFINFIDDKIAIMGKAKTNPLILGEEGLDRLLEIQDECAEAELSWLAVEQKK